MEEKFRSKKIIALIVALISGISVLYSIFVSSTTDPILKEEIKITSDNPELKSQPIKNGKDYWLEFQFVGDYDSVYKIESSGLKYCYYNELKRDIQAYDTLILQVDKNNYIYSLFFKGQDYLDKDKILKSLSDNRKFLIFVRVCILFGCLPIFLFKRQPMFWHSGFEYSFSFSFLFFLIVATAICIYFYINGFEYIEALDINTLK